MVITLTPDLEALVRRKIESGQYENEGEVVREALRLLDARDRKQRLAAALAEGDAEYARGEAVLWTSTSLDELIREADEEDRLGLPINDDVQP